MLVVLLLLLLNVVDAVAVAGALVIIGVNDVMSVFCCHHCRLSC